MRSLLILFMLVAGLLHLLLPLGPLRAAGEVDPHLMLSILLELRLPRTMLVLGYGMVLGVCGAALQAVFANPLASPDISGASSGAALGAVIGSYFVGLTHPLAVALFASGGALVALLLLFAMAGLRSDSTTLLLAGLAVAMAAGAATSLALALAPSPFAFYDAFDWLMGSFVDRSLSQAIAALLPAALAVAMLLRRSDALDLMALGDDVAAASGLRPMRLAREVVLFTAIAVGACVSAVGAIGFVGLVAPFFARLLTRGHPGKALVPAGMIGVLLMTLADMATRLVPLDRPIPVGVLTALFGTPLFIWLVATMRRRVAA